MPWCRPVAIVFLSGVDEQDLSRRLTSGNLQTDTHARMRQFRYLSSDSSHGSARVFNHSGIVSVQPANVEMTELDPKPLNSTVR